VWKQRKGDKMAWVDKRKIDYVHIWYQEWYSKRYEHDLIKPDFQTGLIAARAAIEKFSSEKKAEKEYVNERTLFLKVLAWRGLDGDGITDPLRAKIMEAVK
jgi:hypothetical protein